ncbi:hypothetical protein HK101_000547 [Irineochytrium annulatum]|nr:hypothetical protein HK101_000547 [Irineochytrium annulatum]
MQAPLLALLAVAQLAQLPRPVGASNGTGSAAPPPDPNSYGMDIWQSIAAGLRQSVDATLVFGNGTTPAQMAQSQVRLLVACAVFVLFGALCIPVWLFVSTRCMGRPRAEDKVDLENHDKRYMAVGVLAGAAAAVAVCAITGIRGSASFNDSVIALNGSVAGLLDDVNTTIGSIPDVIDRSTYELSYGLNLTVDAVIYAAINVTVVEAALGSPRTGPGPGYTLIQDIRTLADISTNLTANGTYIDALVKRLVEVVGNLTIEFQQLNGNLSAMNGVFNSTNPPFQYQLTQKLPIFNVNTTLGNATDILNTARNNPLMTPITQVLGAIPNFTSIYSSVAPTFYNLTAVVDGVISGKTRGIKGTISTQIDAAGVTAQNQSAGFVQKVDPILEQIRNMSVAIFESGGDGGGGGAVRYAAIMETVMIVVLVLSGVMMLAVVLSVVWKFPMGLRLTLFEVALLAMICFVAGAVLFAMAYLVGQGCYMFEQKNSTLVAQFDASAGASFKAFVAGRDKCISDPSRSLLSFADDLGTNLTNQINFTNYAMSAFDSFNLNAIQSINITDFLPAMSSPLLNDSTTAIINGLTGALDVSPFAQLGALNLTAIRDAAVNISATLASLLSSAGQPSASGFTVTPSSAGPLAENEMGQFLTTWNATLGLLGNVIQGVGDLIVAVHTFSDIVAGVENGILSGADLSMTMPALFNSTEQILTFYAGQVVQNVTAVVPNAKSLLLGFTNNEFDRAASSLPCHGIMSDTMTVQDGVCKSMSESLDILYLSFLLCGLAMFVCMSCMGPITNRIASRGLDPTGVVPRKGAAGSGRDDGSMSTLSSSSMNTLMNERRGKTFGKATPKIKDTKHVDELLPTEEPWNVAATATMLAADLEADAAMAAEAVAAPTTGLRPGQDIPFDVYRGRSTGEISQNYVFLDESRK